MIFEEPDSAFGLVCQSSRNQDLLSMQVGHVQQITCGGPHLEQRGLGVRASLCAEGWGWAFLLAVFVGAGLYLGIGVAYGKRRRVAALGPLGAHPHAQLWLAVAGLAADGVAFAGRGGRGRGAARGGTPGGPGAAGGGKAKKRAKKERKADKAKRSGGPEGHGQPLLAEAAAPPEGGRGAAAGTAAGDGGRWVHVPT